MGCGFNCLILIILALPLPVSETVMASAVLITQLLHTLDVMTMLLNFLQNWVVVGNVLNLIAIVIAK